MPYSIETEDGIIIEDIPDNIDPNSEELKRRVQAERIRLYNPEVMTSSPKAGRVQGELNPSVAEEFSGAVQTLGAIGGGIADEILSGYQGIGAAINPQETSGAGARAVAESQANPFFKPESEVTKRNLGVISDVADRYLGEEGLGLLGLGKEMGGQALERTGSPLLATAYETLPTVLETLTGIKSARTLQGPVKLKNPDGSPTRYLRDLLNEKNLSYEVLTPEVQKSIPAEIPRSEITGAPVGQTSGEIAARELEAGGRQQGLAPYEQSPFGGTRKSQEAKEAIGQEWDKGIVQMVKVANPDTKTQMSKMLEYMESIRNNPSQRTRPSDVVGIAVAKRVNFVKNKLREASVELQSIAENKLKGQSIDTAPVEQSFVDGLNNLDVGFKMVETKSGYKPEFDFKGSVIEADPSAQTMLKRTANLMANAGNVDAYRMHMLKRQLDSLIDFQKKSKSGLTEEGRRLLKNVRASLNDTLREANPDYARVNDTMSKSLQVFDNLNSNTAGKIDIFDSEMMGQELRKLFSNYQTRVGLDNALADLDDLVEQFSKPAGTDVGFVVPNAKAKDIPQFNESVRDLAMFANALDRQFGAVAKTGFEGGIEAGVANAMRGMEEVATGGKSGMIKATVDWAGKKLKDVKDINEYNAFRSMEELLKRGSK
jgi:hypothetical protein